MKTLNLSDREVAEVREFAIQQANRVYAGQDALLKLAQEIANFVLTGEIEAKDSDQ